MILIHLFVKKNFGIRVHRVVWNTLWMRYVRSVLILRVVQNANSQFFQNFKCWEWKLSTQYKSAVLYYHGDATWRINENLFRGLLIANEWWKQTDFELKTILKSGWWRFFVLKPHIWKGLLNWKSNVMSDNVFVRHKTNFILFYFYSIIIQYILSAIKLIIFCTEIINFIYFHIKL